MRYTFVISSLFILVSLSAASQQSALSIRPLGAGLIAPIILPSNEVIAPQKNCVKFNGVVKFAATVDTVGLPQTVKMLETNDQRLAGFAAEIIKTQRFKPGTINGSATAVAVELTVGLQTCAQREKHPTDDNFYEFTLRALPLIAMSVLTSTAVQEPVSTPHTAAGPVEQVGKHISAPIPTVLIDPKIPVSGKLLKHGNCLLGITVDANGIPQNIHVVRGLEPELDSNAVEAVKNWRFKPALRDGRTPVAAEGTVEAVFEYLEKEPVAIARFIPETAEKVSVANTHNRNQYYTLDPVNADEVIALYMPKSRIAGHVFVSLVIDTNGVPQHVHVIKGLDPSLDMDTVAMVEHFRYKPAMKDATTPVPVWLILPVHFHGPVVKTNWHDMFLAGLALALL